MHVNMPAVPHNFNLIDSAHEKGVLNDNAAALLRTLHQARTDIIQVDYFPNQWHGPAQHNAAPPPPLYRR